jgi:predicted transcriptional regulator
LQQKRERDRERHGDMTYRTKTRTRTEIMGQILMIANGDGSTKTKIMYQAFLSYGQMKEHLRILTENDLLSYDLDAQAFKTTEKGLRFLEAYNQMNGMINALPSHHNNKSRCRGSD